MSVKTFTDEDKNNGLMSVSMDDDKLLEQYKTMWTKFEDLKNIKLKSKEKPKQAHMLIKFILIFVVQMRHKMVQNVSLLQSFLLILYLFMKTNITCKYI